MSIRYLVEAAPPDQSQDPRPASPECLRPAWMAVPRVNPKAAIFAICSCSVAICFAEGGGPGGRAYLECVEKISTVAKTEGICTSGTA